MAGEEAGNYLDDFLTSIEMIPNDVRRNFELIRELDRQSCELVDELEKLEQAYLFNLKDTRMQYNSQGDLEYINEVRGRLKQKVAEKVAIAVNLNSELETYTKKLDNDLGVFDTELRGLSEVEPIAYIGIEPGSEVAIQPNHSLKEYILGEVLSYSMDTGAYEIADSDSTKRYTLPETQVIDLSNPEGIRKYMKGEEVLAVYPDTSTFYPATLTMVNRRGGSYDYTASVQFQGDADEHGITPIRVIPLRHIMRHPE